MTILAEAIVAFVVTYLLTPLLIPKLKSMGIVGTDVHKPSRPSCPEMGGLAVLVGFVGAFSFASFMSPELIYTTFPIFLIIVFVGFIGILDDLFTLKQRYKPFLVALASTPLILANVNHVKMWLPPFGWVYLGSIYLLFIPLAVATASNLTNMLAGFNGLEAGMGAISCFSLGFLLTMIGKWDSASIAFSLFAAFCQGRL